MDKKLLKVLKATALSAVIMLNTVSLTPMSASSSDFSALSYESVTGGQSRFAVTEDLNLTHTVGGETVTWSSNNESVVGSDGRVNRPEIEDEKVTLTATFGEESKEFDITVLSLLSTVISSTEFENSETLENYTVNDQGVTVPVEYNSTEKKIAALYSTVTVENNAVMKIVPNGGKMSTINRKDVTNVLTGTVVIEKRIDVTDGFDLEIKNSLGKRVIKIQAGNGKLCSYSNFNTTDIVMYYQLPDGWFDMKIVADTSERIFSLYIDEEIPSDDFKDKAFMAESGQASDISADKIYLGGYMRTEDRPVLIECESVKTVKEAPQIGEICELLSEKLIIGENSSLDSVEKDLVLKNSYEGLYGAQIEWSVSPENNALKADGTVTQSSKNDITVILTAKIIYNGNEETKNFTVVIKRKSVSPYLKTAAEKLDYSLLLSDGISPFVITRSSDIDLIAKIENFPDVDISWESSDGETISNEGVVTRGRLSDRNVTLKAKLSYDNEYIEKEFGFVVLAERSKKIYSENFNRKDALQCYSLTESGSMYGFDEESGSVQGAYAAITYDGGSALLTPTNDNKPSFMHVITDNGPLTGIVIIQKRVKISRGFDIEIKNSLGKRVIKLQASGNKFTSFLNYNTVDKNIGYSFPEDYFDLKIVADTDKRCFTVYINDKIPGEEFYNHQFMAECNDAVNINPNAIYIGAYPRTSEYPLWVDFESVSTAEEVLTEDQIKERLSDALILGENKSKESVKASLSLKTEYPVIPDAKIEWISDNDAVRSDGTIIRDSSEDKKVVLTAKISYDGYTYIKNFTITVISEATEIQNLLSAVNENLVVGDLQTPQSVSSDLNLKNAEKLFENAEIIWESSNESIISNVGKVSAPAIVDADVTMKATIIIKGITYFKELNFKVVHKDAGYRTGNGNTVLLDGAREVCGETSVSLSLTARLKEENITESVCLAIYTYDKETGEIKGFDYDEKQVTSDGIDLNVTVGSINPAQVIRQYYIWDSLASHKPLCDLPPSYPDKLSAAATAYDAVTLKWEEAHDDFSCVQKYKIYCDNIFAGETSENTFTVRRMDKGQQSEFSVSAVDGSGSESPKSFVNAKTEKMPVCVINGEDVILPEDLSVRCYIETRVGYYGYTEGGKDKNVMGYRITTSKIRPNTSTVIISRVPFVLSDNFISENSANGNFAIEVTYFDEGNETLKLSYDDAQGELHGSKSIAMTNTNKWKTSTVIIDNAKFRKSSNSGNSYANIMVYRQSEGLKVHSIGIMPLEKFTRDSHGFKVEENVLVLRDAAVASAACSIESISGKPAVNVQAEPIEFGAFGINSAAVQIEICYFDSFEGNIILKYRGEGGTTNTVRSDTKGTGIWKKIRFSVDDAAFDGRISGKFMTNADFTLETDSDNPFCLNYVRILSGR